MNYKMLAVDLDGTLTNNKKEITPRTLQSLLSLQQKGVKLVLASGRPVYGIIPPAKELRLAHFGGYILAYNGGQIIRCDTKQNICKKTIPTSFYPLIYQRSKEHGFIIFTYHDEYIISEDAGDPCVQHSAFVNKMESITVDNFLDAINFPVSKFIIAGSPEPLEKMEKKMKKELEGKLNAFRSEPFFLEIVPNGIDKAVGLNILLQHTGISPEELVAIGDGYNDLPMLRLAGLGVAMDNAQEILKKEADFVTLSNEQDGVAEVVERFFV